MTLAVALIGLLIAGVGLVGVIQPKRLIEWVDLFWKKDRLWFAAALRLALGALLIYAAPECRAAQVVRVLGVITVLAAVGLVVLGPERMDGFVRWWTERPPAILRVWSALGVMLGAFLVYAGV
ncbi:MAG: hypothetical protein HQ526_11340 [Actinobacteria bacterium]|nr:hypothetical protein [Actinomycetota bacterium]